MYVQEVHLIFFIIFITIWIKFQITKNLDVKGNIIIWETEGKHAIRKQYEYVLSGEIKDIAWTSDNQRLAVVGEGKMTFGKALLLDTGSSLGEISQVAKQLNAVDIRPVKWKNILIYMLLLLFWRPYKLAAGGEETIVTFYEGPPFKYKKSNKVSFLFN